MALIENKKKQKTKKRQKHEIRDCGISYLMYLPTDCVICDYYGQLAAKFGVYLNMMDKLCSQNGAINVAKKEKRRK